MLKTIMRKRPAFTFISLSSIIFISALGVKTTPGSGATSTSAGADRLGFAELPDGRSGTNVVATVYREAMGFDRKRSLVLTVSGDQIELVGSFVEGVSESLLSGNCQDM